LDLNQEDWLLECWTSSELTSVEASSGSWDDLTTTSVDCISVESDIMDVESDSSHVFVGHDTFFGGPLEGSFHGVLNFVKELNSLSNVNKNVWSSGVWSETPNLL
jgi:hypothetical protein